MIIQGEVLQQMELLENNSQDIIFCDPPYNLGSKWEINKETGKPDIKGSGKAVDFMSKWEGLDGPFLDKFFDLADKKLKDGGRIFMFGLDRQLFPFEYYSLKNNFTKQQSLYWFFMSNFPKGTDLGKQLDKKLGKYEDREVIGNRKADILNGGNYGGGSNKGSIDITTPSSKLAKEFDGYKYSIAPLKQVLETILVFQKSYKKTIAENIISGSVELETDNEKGKDGKKEYEKNYITINQGEKVTEEMLANNKYIKFNSVPTYNVDGNRVITEDILGNLKRKSKEGEIQGNNIYGKRKRIKDKTSNELGGRYPSQLFIEDSKETLDVLDSQTGEKKSSVRKAGGNKDKSNNINYSNYKQLSGGVNDNGGGSKILKKCETAYEKGNYNTLIYDTKVQKKERNMGLENEEDKTKGENLGQLGGLTGSGNPRNYITKNNHPTLKPISLIYNIARLLKLPKGYKQNIFIPFSGTGSEYIGFLMAGFNENNITGVEISEDYVNIANKRIEAFKEGKLDYIKEKADKQIPNK